MARIQFRDAPPTHRLRHALELLVLVGVVGAVGYHLLARLPWLDAFYMAITTLLTVGFREMGEVNAATKLFTMAYLVIGLGIATYAVSNLTALIVEGDLQGYIRERRMEKKIEGMKDHIIVCGLGKMGFQAALELRQAGVSFVIIEQDETKGKGPKLAGEIILYGNAMNDHVLEKAGIHRARGLITALTSDADNVLVVLMARQMAPHLRVVARSAKLGTERQLKAAGADHIVSPYEIGGRRMAALLLNPDMMSFFDVVLAQEQMELGMERILIAEGSQLAGLSLREARLRDRTGALVLGIQRTGEKLRFNPTGQESFQVGDVVLAMGPAGALEAFQGLAHGEGEGPGLGEA
ncbi:MAG TPA: potassium channel protein [Holophagaceae bacterium]|nr:potassium channel protein [Holophagaceae bacterium]